MSTNCQQIYVRAKQSTPANAELVSISTEILARIEADQQALFASIAGITRDRFQTSVGVTSTSAASERVIDLSVLTLPVERLLKVTLSDLRIARQVDVIDVDAELSPRYLVRGQTLVEVSNDWSTTSGTVSATLVYVYGPTTIDPSGAYTQTVSVPDAWADLLVLPLQLYFASQRPMTDPGEIDRLQARLTDRTKNFVAYLTNYGGIRSDRFDVPVPTPADKK
jgi:hypothetical protein